MKHNNEMKFLEGVVKFTLFIISFIVLMLTIKFNVFEIETFAYILGVIIIIGLMDVIDNIVKTYQVIVLMIEDKNIGKLK